MGLGILSTVGHGFSAATIAGAMLLFSVAPAAAGIWLWRGARLKELASDRASDRTREAALVRMASARGGHLTLAEVVVATALEPVHAERLLDALCAKGLAEPLRSWRVSPAGVPCRLFR